MAGKAEAGQAENLPKANWVICPNCSYRYYVGPRLLIAELPAICPKCRTEFDPSQHLEKRHKTIGSETL